MARASQGTKTLPCELLEWDSEHFGFPIGRVAGDALAPGRARAIDEWCLDQGIRCLYLCLDAGDVDSAQVALDHDFHVVDLRVIARRSLEDVAQLPERLGFLTEKIEVWHHKWYR